MKRKPKNYWNKETCKEAALMCKSRKELSERFDTAYKMMRVNGWEVDILKI